MSEHKEMELKFVCPNCGGTMEPSKDDAVHTYVCKDCGCCIDRDEIYTIEDDRVCPNCNQPMNGNECSRCGYDLGSDFE